MRKLVSTGAAALLLGGLLTVASAVPAGSSSFPGENGKIAFTNEDVKGNNEIYVMNPDGSGRTNLTNHPGDDARPSWSPDGKKIAFDSGRNGLRQIFVMNADGSGQKALTAEDGSAPSWSPDGKKIAFASDRSGGLSQIFVMNADGSGQKALTAGDDFAPTWSPDGKKIAFAGDRSGPTQIFVMNANGTGQTNVTNAASENDSPCWSPDGENIVFERALPATNSQIYVMKASGASQTLLTNAPPIDNFIQPCFSPDGEKIVFVNQTPFSGQITVMNADGTNQVALSTDLRDFDPDWQPLEVDADVTVTKAVVGTAPAGSTFQVKVDCEGDHDDKTLAFGETGGTQSFERDSFGPLECDVTEPATGGASTTYICDAGDNAECHDNGRSFTLFEDPGDGNGVHITVTNTFAVVAEPTFTG